MIICAGESLVDVLPPLTEGGQERVVAGGGPMNAAIAAARFGAPTAFVGRVSTDANGELIWDHLNASGVDLRAAQRGPEPTARAVVTVAPVQSFRFEGDNTADAAMTEVDLGPLGPGPHILHTGTLGVFRGDTATTLADLGARFDGLISFDPNIRPQVFPDRDTWMAVAGGWLERAGLVKASDEDLDWLGFDLADLFDSGVLVVLRTVGAGGVEVHLADGSRLDVPAARVDVVDTVGAGDSFCGAVLAQLHEADVTTRSALADIEPADWARIAGLAVTAAGITVSRPGADPPWRRELPV